MSTPFEQSLRDHLAAVDQAVVPPVATVLAGAGRVAERQARRRRGAAVGGVVAVVAIAGAGLTLGPFDSPSTQTVPAASDPTSTVPATVAPTTSVLESPLTPEPGWVAVPPDPRGVTVDADVVWTGSVALVIGGVDDAGQPRDGVTSFDPSSNSWQVLSTEPVPLMWPLYTWAGSQLLAIGWDTVGLNTAAFTFDPADGTWTRGPQAPVGVKVTPDLPWVWTGSELMIATNQGALAYDVPAEEWRVLASFPLTDRANATSVWTGTEWIVWGGGDLDTFRSVGDGAAYDPVTDSWRLLSNSPLGPRLAEGVWTGTEVVILAGRSSNADGMMAFDDGAAYDPATDAWRSLTPGPAHPGFVQLWTGELMLLFAKGGVTAFDPVADEWSMEFGGSGLSHNDRSPMWIGDRVLLLGSYDSRIGGAMFNPEQSG